VTATLETSEEEAVAAAVQTADIICAATPDDELEFRDGREKLEDQACAREHQQPKVHFPFGCADTDAIIS
jgi:hypothetical protein